MTHIRKLALGIVALGIMLFSLPCQAQTTTPAAPVRPLLRNVAVPRPAIVASSPTSAPADEQVQLVFPENIEVRTLIDYVSKRLSLNIIFQDESLAKRRITLTTPTRIPKDSLLGFLQTVLKMSGLAMIDAEQPGWKKIVPSQDAANMLPSFLPGVQPPLLGAEVGEFSTRVFQLQNSSVQTAEAAIKPFLSKPGGSSVSLADRNILIVSDYAFNLRKVAELISLLDTTKPQTSMRFITVKHGSATELARQVTMLLEERDKVAAPGKATAPNLVVTASPRGNQIVVIAANGQADEAVSLIEALDIAEPEPQETNIRFYKLTNAVASNVLATIRALEGGSGSFAQMPPQPGSAIPSASPAAVSTISIAGENFQGPNAQPAAPGSMSIPTPPYYHAPTSQPSGGTAMAPGGNSAEVSLGGGGGSKDKAIVTADPNTNTIIVIGPPATQSMYRQLITVLDKRRPQVMVEVTLVVLDTTNDLSWGVDMSHLFKWDNNRALLASNFGIGKLDPNTGDVLVTPGAGLTAAILAPNIIDAVLRTIANDTRARVVSAPKILVNDNAAATLSAVSEEPYTSVNATNTSQSTSFAGYASAGTTITLTPHISEGEHLALQYNITLNAFTGTGSEGVPPPRNTSQLNSEVTVPDGYCVVVGGLNRENNQQTENKIPLIGDIPIIKYAFGNYTNDKSRQTLYAFIRPVILRDDQFEDLKYLSDRELALANLPANAPASQMQIMH